MAVLKILDNFFRAFPEEEIIMPAVFVGHGAPTFVLGGNPYAEAWKKLGQQLPRPRAIVSISAHWLTSGTHVTTVRHPRTIHDFYGFPQEMYAIQYPAPGSVELAEGIINTVSNVPVIADEHWGFDHGTWCVLKHMYPSADTPVIQISIDYHKPASYHFNLAKELKFLRKRGVLVIGSGNIVHNLRMVDFSGLRVYEWAGIFDEQVAGLIEGKDYGPLLNYHSLGTEAGLAIPTPDHYFPLIYILGLQHERYDKISFPVRGITHGSISMRSVLFSGNS